MKCAHKHAVATVSKVMYTDCGGVLDIIEIFLLIFFIYVSKLIFLI